MAHNEPELDADELLDLEILASRESHRALRDSRGLDRRSEEFKNAREEYEYYSNLADKLAEIGEGH